MSLAQDPICQVHQMGLVPYETAWRLQEAWVAEIAAGTRPPSLMLLEHPHTYTFGRRGQIENLLWDAAELERRGVSVHWVDRGGDVTYHGPGQLVGYPLLPLAPGGLKAVDEQGQPRLPQADYVGYVRRLEATLVTALESLGVTTAHTIDGLTGVWVLPAPGAAPAKIAAIGVKVDVHGISRHGFALNVNPQMEYWQGIIGCGLKGHAVTCLAEIVYPTPDLQTVIQAVRTAFSQQFGMILID